MSRTRQSSAPSSVPRWWPATTFTSTAAQSSRPCLIQSSKKRRKWSPPLSTSSECVVSHEKDWDLNHFLPREVLPRRRKADVNELPPLWQRLKNQRWQIVKTLLNKQKIVKQQILHVSYFAYHSLARTRENSNDRLWLHARAHSLTVTHNVHR